MPLFHHGGIDWPAWISAATAAATFLVVVVTAVLALRGLVDSRRTRYGQLITELQSQWNDPALVDSISLQYAYTANELADLVAKMFGPVRDPLPTPEERISWTRLSRLANLIESMGVLACENVLTHEVIYRMWGGAIMQSWAKWQRSVEDLRMYDKEPDTFQYFEEISVAMLGIAEKRNPSRATSSAAGAAPGTDGQSSFTPRQSFEPLVPDGSPSLTRKAFRSLAVLVAVWLLNRTLNRRGR